MANEVPEGVRPVLLGGGIGAGKSTVAGVFDDHGFEVIVADDVGRAVLAPGTDAVDLVAMRWPDVVIDGVVDRAALAAIVFADRAELDALEAITHPAITATIVARVTDHPRTRTVVEVPVIGLLERLDAHRIAVVAPDEIRIARAVARGSRRDDVVARMASQPTQDAWREWADVVIDNDGPWLATQRLVEALIDDIGTWEVRS
jgi:dephospho-CoA kinase